jgi:hypothetical protein
MAQQQYESQLHSAVRKMIEHTMNVENWLTPEGKLVHTVNGYNVTAEQLLKLDSEGELTAWGITEFAREYEKELTKQQR